MKHTGKKIRGTVNNPLTSPKKPEIIALHSETDVHKGENMNVMLFMVALVLTSLAGVSGIGYGLYLMGVESLPFGEAAWNGFCVWVIMQVTALVFGICSYFKV